MHNVAGASFLSIHKSYISLYTAIPLHRNQRLQGVPINMVIRWRLLNRLRSIGNSFINLLTLKTHFIKILSVFFEPLKKDQDIKNQKRHSNRLPTVMWVRHPVPHTISLDHILESPGVQFFLISYFLRRDFNAVA